MAGNSSAPETFISEERFSVALSQKKVEDSVIQWRQLQQDTIYKIIAIESRTSRYGKCFITSIVTAAGETFKIFAPSSMIKQIKNLKKPSESVYFVTLGVETNRLNNYRKNRFDLIFEPEASAVELNIPDED